MLSYISTREFLRTREKCIEKDDRSRVFLKIPKSFSVISFMANSGLYTPHKNGSSKCSILGTFVGSLEIHGRTRCVTTTSSQELVSHPHTSTSTPYTLAGLQDGRWTHPQRIYSMASLPLLGQDSVAAPCYALRIYANVARKHVTLTPTHGKPLQTTETCGSSKYHKDGKVERLPL